MKFYGYSIVYTTVLFSFYNIILCFRTSWKKWRFTYYPIRPNHLVIKKIQYIHISYYCKRFYVLEVIHIINKVLLFYVINSISFKYVLICDCIIN